MKKMFKSESYKRKLARFLFVKINEEKLFFIFDTSFFYTNYSR